MIEPTESESKAEIDRFANAMISIKGEIMAIHNGELGAENNPFKNAPIQLMLLRVIGIVLILVS